MKLILVFFISVVLFGCSTPQRYAMSEYTRSLNECTSISRSHGFSGTVHNEYMAICMSMTPSSTPMTYPLQTVRPAPYTPNAFGPYSYYGPTWDQLKYPYEFGLLSPHGQRQH